MLLLHAHREALEQATSLAEPSSDARDVAGVGEGADELLVGQCVSPEEGLAALTGDGVEVQAVRFVAADDADFGGTAGSGDGSSRSTTAAATAGAVSCPLWTEADPPRRFHCVFKAPIGNLRSSAVGWAMTHSALIARDKL